MPKKRTKLFEIAFWFLKLTLPREDRSYLNGNFEDLYENTAETKGAFFAGIWILGEVVRSFPGLIFSVFYWRSVMFKNYVTMALRNIRKHKGYSFINITGLAIGMASSLLLMLWVSDELSYDCFFDNSKNIFRIVQERKTDRVFKTPSTPSPLAPLLAAEYPEIENTVRLRYSRAGFIYGNNRDLIYDESGIVADKEIIKVFTYPFKQGDPETALDEPFSMVVTEKMAQVCFGRKNPVGLSLETTNGHSFLVSGVLYDLPKNSHLQFDYIVPTEYLLRTGKSLDRWSLSDSITYVALKKNVNAVELNRRLEDVVQTRTPSISSRLIFQPLPDIHLKPLDGGGPIIYVSIFSILAAFILFIACINFMNLSTARSGNRSLEVGMRKVIGAKRSDLITQFFGDSMVFSCISAVFALFLLYFFLPVFNSISGKQIAFSVLGNNRFVLLILMVTILTGIISGIYPALFLSSFQPVKIFKGLSRSSKGVLRFRRILVVIQFAISLVMIISTLIVSKQLHFMRNTDKGYDSKNLIFVDLGDITPTGYESLRHELLQDSAISSVTATNAPLLWLGIETTGVSWEGQRPDDIMNVQMRTVDFDYLRTFRMKMKEGRFFSKDIAADASENYILNETAVKVMGLKSPVGKWFSLNNRKGRVIGVVKDFFHHSMREEIEPVVFFINPPWNSYLFARVLPGRGAEAIGVLKQKWKQINSDRSFRYSFLDEEINNLYRAEKEVSRLINAFAALALFISCLGLFGLVSFAAEQRTKEIGVRKVLGATVSNIHILLSKEFIKWVLLANIFAWPVAYYAMHRWLQNFANRISIGIGEFITAGALIFAIAVITISYQTLKTAAANPVDALKYE